MRNNLSIPINKINMLYLGSVASILIIGMVMMCKSLDITKHNNLYLLYYSEFTYTFLMIPAVYILYRLNNRYFFNECVVLRQSKLRTLFIRRTLLCIYESLLVSLVFTVCFFVLQLIILKQISFQGVLIAMLTNSLGFLIVLIFLLFVKTVLNVKNLDFLILMVIVLVDFASAQSFIKYEFDIVLRFMMLGKVLIINNNFNISYVLPMMMLLSFLKILTLFVFGYYASSGWEFYYAK